MIAESYHRREPSGAWIIKEGEGNLKVLIVMPLATMRGGAELALIQLIRNGRDQGIDWVVAFLEDGPMVGDVREFGVQCYLVPTCRLRQLHKYAIAVLNLAKIIRREKPSAVCGWMGYGQLYAGLAAKLTGTPSLWSQHHVPNIHYRLDNIAVKLTTAGVITNSQWCYELQQKYYPRTPTRRVYRAFDSDRFDPAVVPDMASAREQLRLPQGVPIIGMVSRLQRWKGVHTLIAAVPIVLQQYPDAVCIVVGGRHDLEPGYEEELQKQIAALGITDHVTLVGAKTNTQIWMSAMDIVVHASDHEPFGVVVLEAMALEKPTIAGSLGGPQEIITHGKNGLLVDFEDHASLAAAITHCLEDADFARTLGRNARLRATEFTDVRYAENAIRAICELTKTA